jgi:lipid-binding SYLF domain-containing protein
MDSVAAFRHVTILAIMLVPAIASTNAQEPELSPDKRLQNATISFREVMHEPDKGISRDLFDKARCVVIIPGVKKGAFIVGVKYGRGFPTAAWRRSGGRKCDRHFRQWLRQRVVRADIA